MMSMRWQGLRATLIAIWTLSLVTPSIAQIRTVAAQVGYLGEWEMTATVTQQIAGGEGQWTGPLSLKHVGFCSADGPEEKVGELRLRMSDRPRAATATLVIDGNECTFRGYFKDSYDGVMTCPGRDDVPMMLSIR